ncbi:Retrovirus-related Pol polyprotein from transposon TNT 1-94 [Melia azedarach]|uniref:Retrovirus-related Pol polyprotein from transposon TNT 1-94 n=1 Tax=Melia azedarach TaxID=155640 RepID=A0ACC1Y1V8_MELAZ|nr:Retrovirus-related Pol polyprotein from transposon TNT 1-94 [Melia azedarach]
MHNIRSSMNNSAIEDCSSPYFLHYSDNPGLVLVSQPLTGDNYTSWSRSMVIALSVKNKLGFVDGSITRPTGTDPLLNSWIRNNNIVISWILNSVSKEISASVIFSQSAYEIWNDLKERFMQRNGPRIFQLRRELMNHTQGQLSVSAYFTKLKTIWEELNNYRPACSCGKCSCGGIKNLADHYQMEYVMSFLMGLNDNFAQVRGQLLLMNPIPPINTVFALISQEEHQRQVSEISSISAPASAMAFTTKTNSHKTNFNQSFNKPNQKKDRPLCTHCGYSGHTIDKCYKLHGYPPGYKPRQKQNLPQVANQVSDVGISNNSNHMSNFVQMLNPSQYSHLMAMLSNHLSDAKNGSDAAIPLIQASGTCLSISINPIFCSSRYWIVDSGATSHICFSKHDFLSMKPVQNAFVILPNQSRISVQHIGTVKLSSQLVLDDVLYVPQFKFNLLSVSALTRTSALRVQFLTDACFVQEHLSLKTIGKGKRIDDLYVIDSANFHDYNEGFYSVDSFCNAFSVVNNVNAQIWHHRLGHLSSKRLGLLQKQLKINKQGLFSPCSICPLAKQRRLSFVSNNHRY